jgi:hypothetical protein
MITVRKDNAIVDGFVCEKECAEIKPDIEITNNSTMTKLVAKHPINPSAQPM